MPDTVGLKVRIANFISIPLVSSTMLRNPVILQSPVFLFLGAGASAPFGKATMAQFIGKLAKQIKNQEQSTLLRLLIKSRGEDLEALLTELDTIIGLDYVTNMGAPVLGSYFGIERDTAKRLRIEVEHEIIREYRHVSAEKSVALYEPILEILFSFLDTSKQCLPIFTTNYDPAIELFCEEKYPEYVINDGFDFDPAARQFYWDSRLLDAYL